MRFRVCIVLLLALCMAFTAANAVYAYKGLAGVPEDGGHSKGGSSPTDGEGGDPDGVGLEQPSGGQFIPPDLPELAGGPNSSATSMDGLTASRMLQYLQVSLYYLIR